MAEPIVCPFYRACSKLETLCSNDIPLLRPCMLLRQMLFIISPHAKKDNG